MDGNIGRGRTGGGENIRCEKKSHLNCYRINEESSGGGSSEGGSPTEGGGVRPLGGRREWTPQHVQAEDHVKMRWVKADICASATV